MTTAAPSSSPTGATFQSLPFRTNFHGTTDISENFSRHTTAIEKDGRQVSHNQFRGRTLIGESIALPASYHVALVDFSCVSPAGTLAGGGGAAGGGGGSSAAQPPRASGVVSADCVSVVAVSPRYTHWEHDRAPDRAALALRQWIELSAVVHSTDLDDEE